MLSIIAFEESTHAEKAFSSTAFISQVLSEDHSCQEAVLARVRANQVARGENPCSAAITGVYCKARKRLPFFE